MGIGMTRVDLGIVCDVSIVSGPAVDERVHRQAAARVKNDEEGIDASAVGRDLLENLRPERRVERGLVDQADGLVEISYPITIKTPPGRSTSTLYPCVIHA
jgi:hypothetical protein